MIINNDTELRKITEEDIHITNSSTLHAHGIINGNVYVEDSAKFYLHGILNGDLYSTLNTSSYLFGTMNGAIMPSDGYIELSGMLRTKSPVPDNVVKIPNCYINNMKY